MIHERIKELRVKNGYSQLELASMLEIGYRTYQRYEYGEREISINALIKLSKIYNVSMDYLSGLTDEAGEPKVAATVEKKIELPDEEAAMLDAFRKCSPEAQIYLLNKAKVMAYEEQHKGMDEEAATGEEDAALLA